MRHIPIGDLAQSLHRSDNPYKGFGMLQAYFDDSGTHGESLITVISGFVATTNSWTDVQGDWLAALEDYKSRYGVTWYHACDVENWKGEWGKVPLDACRTASMRFASVLSKHRIMPVWAAVVNEDMEKYATSEFLERFQTPFDLCFHEAMGQLYWWSKQRAKETMINPFVAHGDYEDRLNAAHRSYLQDGDFSNYIGPISFDSPRRVIQLQAADLIAYQFYHYWSEMEYPAQPNVWTNFPVLEMAVKNIGHAAPGGCYSGDGMRLAVERFMQKRAV